jgi:SPP1 gp7 family putative phage head morphogenesis protein
VVQAAKDSLAYGVATGQSPRVIARDVATKTGIAKARSLTIARTEMLRPYRQVTHERFRESQVVKSWTWLARLDGRCCPACTAMNGTVHPLSEELHSHPNCFPAGTVVSGPVARASSARWYEGEIVQLRTRDGCELTVTPNHPVLTRRGWIAADLLSEGDHVVGSSGSERVPAGVDPDDYQRPALIEQVAETLGGAASVTTRRVPVAAEDFHGDGLDGEVSVVRTDRLLGGRREVALSQPFGHQCLGRTGVELQPLAGVGAFDFDLHRVGHSAPGFLGGGGVGSPLLRTPLGSHEAIRGSRVAAVDTGGFQGSGDRRSADPFGLCERLDALAGSVAPDEIVEVRRFPFRGHVYNLQTDGEWYTANNIIVHNCRCTAAPRTVSWAELGVRGVPDTRQPILSPAERFAALPEADKLAIMGRARLAAYEAGEISLDQMVRTTRSTRWGPGRRAATLKELGVTA